MAPPWPPNSTHCLLFGNLRPILLYFASGLQNIGHYEILPMVPTWPLNSANCVIYKPLVYKKNCSIYFGLYVYVKHAFKSRLWYHISLKWSVFVQFLVISGFFTYFLHLNSKILVIGP